MDFAAMEKDLETEVRKMPVGMIRLLKEMGEQYGAELAAVVPSLIENLKPHVMAALMEGSMGYLDMAEMEKSVMSVIGRVVTNAQT